MTRTLQRGRIGLALLLLWAAPSGSWAELGAKPFKVVCSFYPMYVMALNVAGETPGVRVECMTDSWVGCLHDYQLSPANLKTLGGANVFIANGAGMEAFIDKALRQSPNLKVIEASQGIPLSFHGNPHVWLSLGGAIQETRNIAKGLAAADPARAAVYEENGAKYVARLEELRRQMHAALDGLVNRDIVTFHEAFPYFAAEFNLKVVAVVEREPGSEPSAGDLAKTIETIRKTNAKALFVEPQYPAKCAATIQRETGIAVSTLDPCVTGPRAPAQAREAYVAAMEKNLKVLADALKN